MVGRYVGLLVCFALGINDGRGLERVDGITDGRDDGLAVGTKVGVADGLDDGIGVAIEEGRYVDRSGVGRYICCFVDSALGAADGRGVGKADDIAEDRGMDEGWEKQMALLKVAMLVRL